MNLLLFSDLHCDAAAAARLVELSQRADVAICAGDLATGRMGLSITLDVLRSIDRPLLLVPGNSESADELRTATRDWPQAVVLHGDVTMIDGVEFFGLGGGVPVTPFGEWSFDLTEEQAAERLKDCPSGGVLITHSPPHGVLDVDQQGRHLGSTAIRQAIETHHPRLVVCGHIHNCAGQSDVLGETRIVNAGPTGILWDLQFNS